MTVSVILPVYNKIQYIEKTVSSLLAQSFTDFELLAVDDGSTDGTAALLDRLALADRHLRVLHKVNGGVSSARNAGLKAAKGEWVVFADGDDAVPTDWLERLYAAVQDSGADIVISGVTKVSASGEVLGTSAPEAARLLTAGELLADFHLLQLSGLLGWCVGKLFRKELALNGGVLFDEGLRLAEDLDFFVRLYGKASAIYLLPYAGYLYLQEAAGNSNPYKTDYYSQIMLWRRIAAVLEAAGVYGGENRRFTEERIGAYISCLLLYRSKTNRTGARQIKRLCSERAAGGGALRPTAALYNAGLYPLLAPYALYRKCKISLKRGVWQR